MASRLKRILRDQIHKDQAGFLPSRHLKDNIRNLVDILEMLEVKKNTSAALIFIDADKAFDNISWRFMLRNFEKMEVGREFINDLTAIYAEQKAKIIVNGVVSEDIGIEKGTN